jgi:hypothetical protein
VSQPAPSLNFFSPEHGLHGSARSGMTLLFEGASSRALPDGPEIESTGNGWHAKLKDAFSLDLEAVAPPAELDGVTVRICSATGQIGTQEVTCLATLSETHVAPSWEELDALRTLSALFDEGHAFLAVGRRPRGSLGHSAESTAAWLLNDGEAIAVEDARVSTVYDGEGRQRSAGLELWLPGEDLPLRGSGSVVAGSSLQLESADVHAAIFRWRMGDREGTGSYELMTRAAPDEAA